MDKSASEARLAAVMAAEDSKPEAAPEPRKDIEFCIQLCSAKKSMSVSGGKFRNLDGKVAERKIGGWYKYYLVGYPTREEAAEALESARKVYKDAYVVAFENGEPISVAEAQMKLKEKNRKNKEI
ncbi:MAG: SPOR domain-containing protein [Alistipes putredinis]|nr:MAG: SPOR domain-containing protein [Alistipes putredinis]